MGVEAGSRNPGSRLVAGTDYPATYRGFVERFPDEAACLGYLEVLRWPGGFSCPSCGRVGKAWRASRGRLVCRGCRRQTRVTAGTLFDKTRTPLRTWFDAAWHLSTAKNGLSALALAETLGVSYQVAWPMLHRYRVAMVRADRERLGGEVEVDETFVGGVDHGGKRGRGARNCIVVVALELKAPKGFGRVRLRHIPDASGDNLVPFVCDAIAPGSIDPVHLQAYLDELTFRSNRRNSRSRGLVFRRLLEQAVIAGPITEANVIHRYSWSWPVDSKM